MKIVSIIIMLFLFCGFALSSNEKVMAYKNIYFFESFDSVFTYISGDSSFMMDEYDIKFAKSQSNHLHASMKLAGLYCDVFLGFNESKLTTLTFYTTYLNATDFESVTLARADKFSKIITNKYGKPKHFRKINFLDFGRSKESNGWIWEIDNKKTIRVGVISKDLEYSAYLHIYSTKYYERQGKIEKKKKEALYKNDSKNF